MLSPVAVKSKTIGKYILILFYIGYFLRVYDLDKIEQSSAIVLDLGSHQCYEERASRPLWLREVVLQGSQ